MIRMYFQFALYHIMVHVITLCSGECVCVGYWEICESVDKLHKHAHLHMHRDDGMIIAFVDPRRFGSWHINDGWDESRGPCPVEEYDEFRDNVLSNLHRSSFDACISDVLLDQRWFNGIGNYLRAEICYRSGVNPFMKARDALLPLLNLQQKHELYHKSNQTNIKRANSVAIIDNDDVNENTIAGDESLNVDTNDDDSDDVNGLVTTQQSSWNDILQLCNQLPREVFNLRFKYHNMEASRFNKLELAEHSDLLRQAFHGNTKILPNTDLSGLGFSDWYITHVLYYNIHNIAHCMFVI